MDVSKFVERVLAGAAKQAVLEGKLPGGPREDGRFEALIPVVVVHPCDDVQVDIEVAASGGVANQKYGLAEIDGEVKLVPQAGEVLTVPDEAGEHVWDGVEDKDHAGWLMQHGGSRS